MVSESDNLLNAKSMDGPKIGWTIADLFNRSGNARLAMTYHVMGAGYDFLTPIGAIVGGALYASNLYRPYPTALSMMGTTGLVAGSTGMVLGLALMTSTARKGEAATPVPWTDDGIQQRIDGISHNFKVRVMDLSVWSGIGAASVVLVAAGGPTSLGLSAGTIGVLQALSLGSTVGSLAGLGCIAATSRSGKDDGADEE